MKQIIAQLIDDFYERELPNPVPRYAALPEIKGKAAVVIGMRRAGKTWFCFQKIIQLLASGIPKEKILYLNFEDDRLLDFQVHHFQEILDVYFGKYPDHRNTCCYFFLDEIQRVDHWEMFIRRLLDTEKVQIVITGSSSKLLSTEIATSLRGRSFPIEIFPFSFSEFLRFRGEFAEKPKTFGQKTVSQLREAARVYLEIGGFPEVQGLDRHWRVEILQGYIDSVLLKDVIERHQVGNVAVLKHLVRHMMNAAGKKFSVNHFYNTLKSMSVKCTKNSLYEYMDHLMDAFLFFKVPIHSRSEKARMINPPKIYTIDTGLLSAMTFRNSTDYGPLLEHLVFMHLRRSGHEVAYVTTKNGYETDFLARPRGDGEAKLIQVCWDMSDQKTLDREIRGLKGAMAELGMAAGTIVTFDDEFPSKDGIEVVPVWKWLLS